MADEMRLGALEAGGTKMVLAIGTPEGKILEQESMPTTAPEDVVPKMVAWFAERDIKALGVGAFGPTGVNPKAANYGFVLKTPKLGWSGYDFRGELQRGIGVPVGYDTDVNVACLGEVTFGASKDLSSVVYLTVGTGIGAGVYLDGNLLHGMLHPEAGHILVVPNAKDPAGSNCPFHASCLEGRASGPAIQMRWGKPAVELADNPDVWEVEADYLAQALTNYVLTYSPQRIILGGGVMHQEMLFPLIRTKVVEYLNGYINTPEIEDMDTYITPNSLDDKQGILGCIELARREVC